jgi:hypothetical protein
MANSADRGRRIRPLVTGGQVAFVEVGGSRVAERAEHAWRLQYAFARDPTPENERALQALAGRRIGGHVVDSDPDLLIALADAGAFGELDMAEAYRELFG